MGLFGKKKKPTKATKATKATKKVLHERAVIHDERFDPNAIKDKYDQLAQIGQGGQGKVWIVKRVRDGKVLVRKEQRRFDMHSSGIPVEQFIFQDVLTPHPSILGFDHANFLHGDNGRAPSLVLYFEHCKGGDLSQFQPRNGDNGPSEMFLWQVFLQLADAIAFLHYGYNRFSRTPDTPPLGWRRIVHCDIKPGNVFLRYKVTKKRDVPEIVLGDFGLATLKETTRGGGTDEWIGPEIPVMTKENDVWGVGAIIHALAHGKGPVSFPPRDWPRGRDAVNKWYRDPRSRRPKGLPVSYSSQLNRNMMDCLVMDRNKRISSLQLVKNLVNEMPRGKGRR